jgi:hypothetical protein
MKWRVATGWLVAPAIFVRPGQEVYWSNVPQARAITPPPRRRRSSQVDYGLVKDLASIIQEGNWATDSELYSARNRALVKAQAYRRAIAEHLKRDPSEVTTRVWGEGDQYQFAIGLRERDDED